MAAVLFKAQLVDDKGKRSAEMARILFGVDSVADKEKSFRAVCKQKYPHLRIEDPISISAANLWGTSGQSH